MNFETFSGSDISIVIPSFNSSNTISECLNALMQQTLSPLEIIVVDSSEDNTPELICQNFPMVPLIHINHRLFPGSSRNLGAKSAKGSIIAFIDADCIASNTWVQQIAENHSKGCLVVGGAIDVGDPSKLVAWAGHIMEFNEFLPIGAFRSVPHIPSCNLSYRKLIFEETGGFPESYYPQEDLILNYLLGLGGVKIWFDPSLRIRHFCRDELHSYLSHQHRIGRVTRCSLRKLLITGSQIARYKWIAWILSPVLGVVKFLRTTLTFLYRFPAIALRHPSIILLIAIGIIWWVRGFSAGARRGLSGIRGWDDPNEPIFSKISSAEVFAR